MKTPDLTSGPRTAKMTGPCFEYLDFPGTQGNKQQNAKKGKTVRVISFLHLHLELRNQIYGEILEIHPVSNDEPQYPSTWIGSRIETAILGVCKQIHQEASLVLYDHHNLVRVHMDPQVTQINRNGSRTGVIEAFPAPTMISMSKAADENLGPRSTYDISFSQIIHPGTVDDKG